MIFLYILTLLAWAQPCPTSSFEKIETIVNTDIDEASGLIATENILWIHNDSGDSANLYAVDLNGKYLGTSLVKGAASRDWEEMGSFTKDGQRFLLIGDMGDNKEKQSFIEFYVVKEPQPAEKVSLEYYFTVGYKIGPKDAEAMFVDPQTNELVVITKGREGTYYWLKAPIPNEDKHISMEVFHQQKISDHPLKTDRDGTIMITAADISPDGSWIVIRNYLSATMWYRPKGQSLSETVKTTGCKIPLPLQPQGETIAFSPDGMSLWTLSEGDEPILYQIKLNYPKY
jgi:hypothetical protein